MSSFIKIRVCNGRMTCKRPYNRYFRSRPIGPSISRHPCILQTLHRYIVTSLSLSHTHPPTTRVIPQHATILFIPHHTVREINNILTAAHTTCPGAHVHLSHPTIPITFNQMRNIHQSMHPVNTYYLSHCAIYHHLLLSTKSLLIPRDRYLSFTMYNTTHPLTPKRTNSQPTGQHYFYLFFNPYKRSPYL